MQYSIKKLTIKVVLKMFSIAVVQTKVISCNSANKSFIWQEVHTKAIAALTQFCDFFCVTLFWVVLWVYKRNWFKIFFPLEIIGWAYMPIPAWNKLY